jgi:site-specific DNA recombinase
MEAAVESHWATSVRLPDDIVEQVRTNLVAELQVQKGAACGKRQMVLRQIDQIDRKRGVWAEKVVNGSVPDDIGRNKQNELTRQLVRARQELTTILQAATDITVTLNLALDLLPDCAAAYRLAEPRLRRQWNQAFFERLNVDADEVTDHRLRAPFDTLLDAGVIQLYSGQGSAAGSPRRRQAPQTGSLSVGESGLSLVVGLSNEPLVEVTGLEPATSTLRT